MTPEELANLAHLRRARDLMDREHATPLDVAAIARAALMSPAHFTRQFRAAYGETPHAYLMTRRVERAKLLLRRDDMTVTEVCLAVGCSSLGSFSSRFTQLVGETPSAYRSRAHDELVDVPSCIAKEATRPASRRSRNGEARVRPHLLGWAAWNSACPPASCRSTIRSSRSPSTATTSASRCATTSPTKATAGSRWVRPRSPA